MTANFPRIEGAALPHILGGVQAGARWWWQQISTLWPISTLLAEDRPESISVRVLPEPPDPSSPWMPLAIETATQDHIDTLKQALGETAATVVLGPSQLYVCQARFPKAALKAGSEALDYHLQTASPLPVEQIYYDSTQRPDGNTVQVDIALVRRTTIESIIQVFEANGLALERIEGSKDIAEETGAEGSQSAAFCFYKRVSFGQGLLSARTALALCASLAMLPLLCAALMWAYGGYLSQSLEAKLDNERATYAQEIALARDFDRYEAIQAQLGAASTPGEMAILVTEVSGAVPRSAWLDRLSFDKRALSLQGYSADANGVASTLRTIPALQNIRLDRVTASGGDQRAPLFAISADWPEGPRDAQ